eukprot:GHVU01192381.1.p5 GENE.GHVU01192381.1~~GHVU01192381.1.p5  ORF type:complete len:126 (-),score=24.72 GHVU01192381.1:1473-1850(-)
MDGRRGGGGGGGGGSVRPREFGKPSRLIQQRDDGRPSAWIATTMPLSFPWVSKGAPCRRRHQPTQEKIGVGRSVTITAAAWTDRHGGCDRVRQQQQQRRHRIDSPRTSGDPKPRITVPSRPTVQS